MSPVTAMMKVCVLCSPRQSRIALLNTHIASDKTSSDVGNDSSILSNDEGTDRLPNAVLIRWLNF